MVSLYYGRAIKACLAAVGAPEDLVQIVHGYGEAGNACHAAPTRLSLSGPRASSTVMKAAIPSPPWSSSRRKDPFIVLEDASLSQCVLTLRGAFQSCCQNRPCRAFSFTKIHD